MRHSVTTAFAATLVAVALGIPARASAGTTELFQFTDAFAQAFFLTSDATGCVETVVFLSAGTDVNHNPPSRRVNTSGAFISISQFDNCTFSFSGGSGFVEGVVFSTNPQVKTASLSATIPVMFSAFPGPGLGTVNVAVTLTWKGGDLSREIRTVHLFLPGSVRMINSTFTGNDRDATATGAVIVNGTNLTPDPSAFGRIGFEGGHEVRVNR